MTMSEDADLKEDELTNYRLVIEQRWRTYDIMMAARQSANFRLMSYMATAVGLLIFLALARPSPLSEPQMILLFLTAGFGGALIALAADGLKASFNAPGNDDWPSIHRDYIMLSTEKCLMQILSDLLDANRSLEEAMNKKADATSAVARLLAAQALLTVGYWLGVTLSG